MIFLKKWLVLIVLCAGNLSAAAAAIVLFYSAEHEDKRL